jgi:hypothetical protein
MAVRGIVPCAGWCILLASGAIRRDGGNPKTNYKESR